MKIIVMTDLKWSIHSLYRITYINGYVYVGSCSASKDKGRRVAENYFGSSRVALHYGWRKENTSAFIDFNKSMIDLFEVWYYDKWDPSMESRFINNEASRLGIADCADILTVHKEWTSLYRKGGLLLNLHDNTMKPAIAVSAKKIRTQGPSLAQRCHYNSMAQYQICTTSKEARERAVITRRKNNPDWAENFIKRGQSTCHSDEAIKKRINTLRSRRQHYIIDEKFVGDYEQIADYLGVHKVLVGKWLHNKAKLPKRVGKHEFRVIVKENIT